MPSLDAANIDDPLRELASEAWRLHREASTSTSRLVLPSMPILYFGDARRYASSPIRIVTAGLNPSREEFPSSDRWRRFPEGRSIDPEEPDLPLYLESLDRYFDDTHEPYAAWFDGAFGALLRGLGADYRGQAANVALHTDLCSPLATDPTWSGLAHAERQSLQDGYALWHRLIEALQPQVILMSVAEEHRHRVTLPASGEWTTVHSIAREHPYEFLARRLDQPSNCLLVWGRAAQLPFGTVSGSDKEAAGAAIRSLVL